MDGQPMDGQRLRIVKQGWVLQNHRTAWTNDLTNCVSIVCNHSKTACPLFKLRGCFVLYPVPNALERGPPFRAANVESLISKWRHESVFPHAKASKNLAILHGSRVPQKHAD